MSDQLINVEIINGIQIKMDPKTQRYEAPINGKTVALKSLTEIRKRCRATFEPVTILVVRDEPRVDHSSYSAIREERIRGISEHSRNYGNGKEYRLQVDSGPYQSYETTLSGDMYVHDAALLGELEAIESEGRAFMQSLKERWRKTLAAKGRPLAIESLLQGQTVPPSGAPS